jgi:hypothetical protein
MLESITLVLLASNLALSFALFLVLKVAFIDPLPTTPVSKPNLDWLRANKSKKRRKPIIQSDEAEWKKEQDSKSIA